MGGIRHAGRGMRRLRLAFPGCPAREPRFPQLTVDQLNDQQRPLGEQIVKVSSVGLGGPYNPLLRSPVLGQRMFDLLYYLRWNTSVPLHLNEFAILIIGRQWRSQVEWFAHAPIAQKAGLSPQIIAELKANKRPSDMAADEAAVYDFVTELTPPPDPRPPPRPRGRGKGVQRAAGGPPLPGPGAPLRVSLGWAGGSRPPPQEGGFVPGGP